MATRRVTSFSLIGIAVVGIAAVTAEVVLNPLRRSDEQIRKWVLTKTPIGSTREQVMAVIAKEHWGGHREFRGALPRTPLPPPERFYGADLGSYQGLPFRCRADASWTFTWDDRVADVYVSTACEGL